MYYAKKKMDSTLKSFGHAQMLLAQLIFRRKNQQVQIWQPGSIIIDESQPIERLEQMVLQADLIDAYSASLQKLWGDRGGVGVMHTDLDLRCKAVISSILFLTPKKHVIFLGAGASASAGYQLGSGLAELMREPNQLRNELQKCLQLSGMSLEKARERCGEIFDPFISRFQEPLQMFKVSGYSTIDHFSK